MGTNVASIPLTVGTAGAVAQAATEYSEKCSFRRLFGTTSDLVACMHVVSTAGTITVTQQCSLNGDDWFDPVDSAGSNIGEVISGQGVTTGRWVSFEPVLTRWIRFKVVEDNSAATTVTLELIFKES